MIRRREILLAIAGAALAGCSGTKPSLSPAQLEAIETRHIDAPPEATFRAVAGVMLDRGMLFTLSDAGAGLVAADTWQRFPVTDPSHTHGTIYSPQSVTGWVRPAASGGSLLRVQFAAGPSTTPNAEAVSLFADEVARRTLIATPTRSTP